MNAAERRLALRLAGGGLLVLTIVLTSQLYIWLNLWPIRVGWWTALVWSLPQLLLWALAIPGIARLSELFPLEGNRRALRLCLHIVASVAVALLVLGVLDISDRLLHWTLLLGAPRTLVTSIDKTILHLHVGLAIYWVVLAVHHARGYYRQLSERELRAAQLETMLAEAQLHALRMQLNPHFLFNTLNSIGVLMRHDVEGAERMLNRLGDLLRGTLLHAGVSEVDVRTELAYVRSYLEIEQLRFGDRLQVSFDIDADAEGCRIPYLVLQPLVENAIKHGIAPRGGGARGHVMISAHRSGADLVLAVRNDGPGLDANSRTRGHGVGLSNVSQRLERRYGTAQRLDLRDLETGGVEAQITLPCGRDLDEPAAAAAGWSDGDSRTDR